MLGILCIDLGTKTGWAQRARNGQVLSGHEDFTPGRFEGGGMRFLRFKGWLLRATQDVDLLFYEEVRSHRGVDASHVYGGLMATLQSYCEARGAVEPLPYQGVPVGTIKKSATGKGNASKARMLSAANSAFSARLGRPVLSHDEADALALLGWAIPIADATEGTP